MENVAGLSVSTVASSSVKQDLICFSHLRWEFVTQRPQHLMRRAALKRRVFFWEEPIWHERKLDFADQIAAHLEIVQESSSLWVIRPHLLHGDNVIAAQQKLLAQLCKRFTIDHCIRWFYTAMALPFTSTLSSDLCVYDCMDELSGFVGAPRELVQREQDLFRTADVVFTGGLSLYEAKRREHHNVHAFPSSIDRSHFASAIGGQLAEPKDQADIPAPRAGFYGVVDERFDADLLRSIASLRPSVHFVILGPIVKIDPATLPQARNIHYLSGKKYEELPAYLSGWAVALMPFALSEATRFISPTKTPEYLAAGRPVVSTAIRDVERSYGDCGLVSIAHSAEEFVAAIDAALLPALPEWEARVDAALENNSWDSTWSAMDAETDRLLNEKRRSRTLRLSTTPQRRNASVASAFTGLRHDTSVDRHSMHHGYRTESFDYIVVGAGFAGAVLAERLASQLGRRVLIIDKRDHIAGNAYDCRDAAGILIHRYGPHIFHTNSTEVVDYLSDFTAWRPYEHRVLASVEGQLLPVPINLDTINRLYDLSLNAAGMEAFLAARVEVPREIRTSEDIVVSRVGRELFEKFFRNYTKKQWGLEPSQLDASVAGRIPVRFNQDDRYFADTFQAMPRDGFTRMFERMLDHPRITIRTGVDYQTMLRTYPDAEVIYTGPIDEYFSFCYGPLPYRSLEFKHETHAREVFQSAPVINYPNEYDYTRVTEFKYLTGQKSASTSIVYEYPRDKGDPYYPIPRPENAAIYARYRELAVKDDRVHFCGRLANYKYFNMDQVVAQALATYRRIAEQSGGLNLSTPMVGARQAPHGAAQTAVMLPLTSEKTA